MRLLRGWSFAGFGVTALGLAGAAPASAQLVAAPREQAESVTIAAGSRYASGGFHRWVAGNGYRDLWTMPIRVPVLHLDAYAGGLTPTKAGGGLQSKSLRLEAADGTEYVFRLSDKGSSAPPEFRHTLLERTYQDQVSASHPGAAVIAAPIIEASGVLHPTAVLMVLADDAALGKYRGDFAGRLGMLEKYPNVPKHAPGFGGATKIIDSDKLLHLVNSDPREQVDARAFLAARLTDFLINDNDRHPGNWKWARLRAGPGTQWEPIARDRDHAFIAFDGWLMGLARLASPDLVRFEDAPNVPGLTHNKGLDARLLAGLEKPVWDSVARALQSWITDSVIHAAAQAMPSEYQASAPQLEAVLRKRRDGLPGTANEFYRELAARVEVHGTDAPERAVINRVGDGLVDVRVESEGTPWFVRRFDARETSEILVYLHGGDDTALVTGRVEQSIRVRIIGGNGTNTFMDSSTVAGQRHPTGLYDGGTVGDVTYGRDTLFDRRPWERKNGKLEPPGPDVGAGYVPFGGVSLHRRTGFTPHIGVVRYGYGFAKRPYASMVKLEGDYAFGYGAGRVGLTVDKRLESSPVHFMALARLSQLEMVGFYGFGNATADSGAASTYFEMHQIQWLFEPAIALAVGSRADIALGPVIQHSATDSSQSSYLAATRPYGFGSFDQVGVRLAVRYEWSSVPSDVKHESQRFLVALEGRYFPAAMDVRSAFTVATVAAGVAMSLPVPTHPLLVVRAGGRKVYGDYPFYEAATIGSEGTIRHMDTQRYAGDASLYATSELRIPLARFRLWLPIRMGILGLAEAGRVYVAGSSPGGWHTRLGEGIWFGLFNAPTVLTLTWTTEPGHTGASVLFGLTF